MYRQKIHDVISRLPGSTVTSFLTQNISLPVWYEKKISQIK